MRQKLSTPQYQIEGIPIILNDLQAIYDGLKKDTVIGIDLETTGFNAWRNNIALVQVYGEQSGTLGLIQVTDGVIPQMIMDLFTKDRTFVIHNGVGFDLWFMHTHGIPWRKSKWYDTLVGEMVLTPTGRKDIRRNLGASIKRRLGKEIDKTIEHGHWAAETLSERQLQYAAEDVINLPALYRSHLEKAEKSNELPALEMEMRLVPYVAQMSINGLPMRKKFLEKFVREQRAAIKDAEAYLYKVFGPINLGSWQQLKKGLHDVGIPVPSTGVEILAPLAMASTGTTAEILEQILIWKHGAQRIKMFGPDYVSQHIVNDWAHPHFWQCSADTTRFTSSDPNFQQIPKDSRYVIGNMPGLKIVSADYSQIEVRISAFYAKDEKLLAALEEEDVHRAIAAETFQKRPEDVTKDERKLSKALTFTLLFGGGAGTLYNHSRASGGSLTEEMAADLANIFFGRFQGLAQMKKKAENLAATKKMMRAPVVLRLPNSARRILVGPSVRSTVILNTMVQGTAAVGIKYGILQAGDRGLVDEGLGSTVHDELVAAVENKRAKEYGMELHDAMITGMREAVDVTVKVDVSIGDNWQA